MERIMTIASQAYLHVFLYTASLSVAIPFLLYCFYNTKDRYRTQEQRMRRNRRGQVRRAAKKAGMSFREYSIRHFS